MRTDNAGVQSNIEGQDVSANRMSGFGGFLNDRTAIGQRVSHDEDGVSGSVAPLRWSNNKGCNGKG